MGYDPGQMQNRWLAARKLAAGEIDTSADLIPVFGAGERSMSPADYYIAAGGGGMADVRITPESDIRITPESNTRITGA